MKPFAFQHMNLEDHPVFVNISVIHYKKPLYNEVLTGSGKPYLCFTYGKITKITSEGQQKEVSQVELQPVENYYSLSTEANSRIIALSIKPDLLFNITNTPIGKQTGNVYHILEPGLQNSLNKIKNRLENLSDIEEIWAFIESELATYNSSWKKPVPISHIIDYIFERKGHISLQEILQEFPLAKSTLHAHFKKYIGLPPKFYIRLIHFNFIVREMLKNNSSVKDFIYDSNYYDYSHFKKDFKIFLGINPAELEKIKDKSLATLFDEVAYRLR